MGDEKAARELLANAYWEISQALKNTHDADLKAELQLEHDIILVQHDFLLSAISKSEQIDGWYAGKLGSAYGDLFNSYAYIKTIFNVRQRIFQQSHLSAKDQQRARELTYSYLHQIDLYLSKTKHYLYNLVSDTEQQASKELAYLSTHESTHKLSFNPHIHRVAKAVVADYFRPSAISRAPIHPNFRKQFLDGANTIDLSQTSADTRIDCYNHLQSLYLQGASFFCKGDLESAKALYSELPYYSDLFLLCQEFLRVSLDAKKYHDMSLNKQYSLTGFSCTNRQDHLYLTKLLILGSFFKDDYGYNLTYEELDIYFKDINFNKIMPFLSGAEKEELSSILVADKETHYRHLHQIYSLGLELTYTISLLSKNQPLYLKENLEEPLDALESQVAIGKDTLFHQKVYTKIRHAMRNHSIQQALSTYDAENKTELLPRLLKLAALPAHTDRAVKLYAYTGLFKQTVQVANPSLDNRDEIETRYGMDI